MAACAAQRLCTKAVFWELVCSGRPVSQSAGYRTLQQLEAAGLLLREWHRLQVAGPLSRFRICLHDTH